MREVTKLMINNFKIMKLGIDFMGYEVKRKESLSFHHLIVPKRLCKEEGLGDGYLYWNGAILVQATSHDYLHIIQRIDRDYFEYITNRMVYMNIMGKLDSMNIKQIHEALESFEREYYSEIGKDGKKLIKKEYMRRPMI